MGGDNGTLAPANIVKICVFSYGPGGMVYKEGGGALKRINLKSPPVCGFSIKVRCGFMRIMMQKG